jgi:hypothetical protein
MIYAILKKEWIKVKLYFFALVFIAFWILLFFMNDLHFSFSNIEPESMMWYRFVHLEEKPYFSFIYLYLGVGIFLGVVQFIPERIKNRIRIMAHLPISMQKSLLLHVSVGIVLLIILLLFLSVCLFLIFAQYYPLPFMKIIFKDFTFYIWGAILAYLCTVTVILQMHIKTALIECFIGIVILLIFIQKRYFIDDILWGIVVLFLITSAIGSFYSIKHKKFTNLLYLVFFASSFPFIYWKAFLAYQENYHKYFNKYYIFYSPVREEFIYQKNFGNHHFEYGIKDEGTFGQTRYESYLPFVYWKNLDIQGKLPLHVKEKIFTKEQIKASRLSFSYYPKYLNPLELQLYPFINANTQEGMLRFPENVLYFGTRSIVIYNYAQGKDERLSRKIAKKLEQLHVSFPIKKVWGKASNMKPFDLGYLFLDKEKKLFNIRRVDSKILIKQIPYPKNMDLVFIKLSENRKRVFAGYAIDKASNIYILSWDFKFQKLDLDGFDYKKNKLQFIANPLYYLVRFDDGKSYHASVFNKKLEKIKEVEFH